MNPFEKPAQECYERYAEHSGGKNYLGKQMPSWNELPQDIQDHWMFAIAPLVRPPGRPRRPSY